MTLMTACSEDALDKELEDSLDTDKMTPPEDYMADNPSNTNEKDENGKDGLASCQNVSDYIFQEIDGLIKIEFENAEFSDNWKLKTDGTNFSGKGYMVWEGAQQLGQPGNEKTAFTLQIEHPGTYQFLWKSAVKTGDSGSDHNDTWLRFGDADDFYAQKGNSVVYPMDTGKSSNPDGASKDGWFKIYRSGNDLDFKWQAKTFDNNAHDIFVVFENKGLYTMEISARSSGHAIDKFVLFKDIPQEDAIADTTDLSEVRCQ
ncbi:hypothetical protein SAMN05421636_101318 [Pricia antarctica]|uniref:Uncharacterized protein n=2 Tax=Pricia antarctica TaxID=641691 RepID=A0A1G6WHP3_9FLAO|nr:hypothetical protein SAMN05421636_101318 [Pricia antarctica]